MREFRGEIQKMELNIEPKLIQAEVPQSLLHFQMPNSRPVTPYLFRIRLAIDQGPQKDSR